MVSSDRWSQLIIRNTISSAITRYLPNMVLSTPFCRALWWQFSSTRKFCFFFIYYSYNHFCNTERWIMYIRNQLPIVKYSTLNREWLSDTCWTASMYLEAVAMLPQIYMFQKQAADEGGSVEVRKCFNCFLSPCFNCIGPDASSLPMSSLAHPSFDYWNYTQTLIGHTMFALGFARIFEFLFWLGSFKELSDHNGSRLPGYIVLISQIAHLIIMADFFYYWAKSVSKGVPMELPQSYSSVV